MPCTTPAPALRPSVRNALPPRFAVDSVRVPALAVPSALSVPPHAGVRWFTYVAPVAQYAGDSRQTVPAVSL